ncbi:response regulator transcription factor (plasmid) [Deinococcus sp. KNUC1210]|uniref:response regulator transcription factor n=1 Tax=Deinococcus sp. KNUC1210 TaxID=2917691 RepID=UPI001EEF904D|nr:response regulator transcription factor [Deinococcus sp. KNUC1210]ULH17711.1 response regulator transcription factor [Deinococcus sp. KNUC1210]
MSSQHILIVEDDPDIARLLQLDLEGAGYQVSVANSVMMGLIQAREQVPALILLDLGLPDGDGREVLVRLRRSSELPVIVLTARDVVGEKVELLELGADDYVVKPFQIEELLARIAVQLRQQADDTVLLGELALHPQQRLLSFRGQELPLSPKEFELVQVMMRQPGKVFSRAELNQDVWAGQLPRESNVIDVHLANLRAKLRDVQAYGLLRTVRGYGYALRA